MEMTSWPTFSHCPVTTLTHDHAFMPPRHDLHRRGSHSQEADWQALVAELEKGNGLFLEDLTMSSNDSTSDSALMPPRSKNEKSHIQSAKPQLTQPMQLRELQEASNVPEQQYPGCFTSPTTSLHPLMPLENQWLMQQQQHLPHVSGSSYFPIGDCERDHTRSALHQPLSIPDHHEFAVPPSTLHRSSPFDGDSLDDDWNRIETPELAHDATGRNDFNDADLSDPCYAQLLYRCLREAPSYTLSLRDLYEWISLHSQKAKDNKNRGWQNSVRHNLSMNAAFERVPLNTAQGIKKGSFWRLTEQALHDGVISTTRYRKDPKRKSERRGEPALARQRSGAKGGQATRAATRRQHALRERHRPYAQTYMQRERPSQAFSNSNIFGGVDYPSTRMAYPRSHPVSPRLHHHNVHSYDHNQNVPSFPGHYASHHHLVHHTQPQPQPQTQPSSPYFIDFDDNLTTASTSTLIPYSKPQTPQSSQLHLGYPPSDNNIHQYISSLQYNDSVGHSPTAMTTPLDFQHGHRGATSHQYHDHNLVYNEDKSSANANTCENSNLESAPKGVFISGRHAHEEEDTQYRHSNHDGTSISEGLSTQDPEREDGLVDRSGPVDTLLLAAYHAAEEKVPRIEDGVDSIKEDWLSDASATNALDLENFSHLGMDIGLDVDLNMHLDF